MTYCEGVECSKRDTCELHRNIKENEVYEYIDWSTYGSGSFNSEGIAVIEHSCGDLGEFKHYKPFKPEETESDSKIHTKIQMHDPNPIKHDTYSLIQCANCKSHGISISMDENDYLKIKCGWCGVTSRIKLFDDNSIFKYKSMWNELKSEINKRIEYHKNGEMQSISESIHGETACREILNKMNIIEETNRFNDIFINSDTTKVTIEDIREHADKTWNKDKDDSNRCLYCNNKIIMIGQIDNIQTFLCNKCNILFKFNINTQEMSIEDRTE